MEKLQLILALLNRGDKIEKAPIFILLGLRFADTGASMRNKGERYAKENR